MNHKLTDSGLISVPDSYSNSSDDATLKRSFEAMKNGIIAELRTELADSYSRLDRALSNSIKIACNLDDMTEQRDQYRLLLDAAVEIMKADRLDAQRWQFFLTAQDETTPENAAFVSAANALYPDDDLSKVMALAMKGGQP